MNFLDPVTFEKPQEFEEKYEDLNESAVKEMHAVSGFLPLRFICVI
jgi:hypothetical protein